MYRQRLDAPSGRSRETGLVSAAVRVMAGGGEKWADSEGIWEMKYGGLRGREKESGMTPRVWLKQPGQRPGGR